MTISCHLPVLWNYASSVDSPQLRVVIHIFASLWVWSMLFTNSSTYQVIQRHKVSVENPLALLGPEPTSSAHETG